MSDYKWDEAKTKAACVLQDELKKDGEEITKLKSENAALREENERLKAVVPHGTWPELHAEIDQLREGLELVQWQPGRCLKHSKGNSFVCAGCGMPQCCHFESPDCWLAKLLEGK